MNANNAMNETLTIRPVQRLVLATATLEGGGFPVRRPLPSTALSDMDPFLLLDHLGPVTWGPNQGIGAPTHPHRGFETVTYLLSGAMEHADSFGHRGKLGPGDVQWMTAGSGLVHSELPSADFMRDGGVMHGFQVWVNLPAKDKMIAPHYQEISSTQIPEAVSADGRVKVRIIAGAALGKKAVIATRTPIMFLHYTVQPGGKFIESIPSHYRVLAYAFAGDAVAGPDVTPLPEGTAAVFGEGEQIALGAQDRKAEVLVLAGVPLNEPVARHGPFVMNRKEELLQAFQDYQTGKMGRL
jgi:hypothetical protein